MVRASLSVVLVSLAAAASASACGSFGDGDTPASPDDAGNGGGDASSVEDASEGAVDDAAIEGNVDAGPKGDGGNCTTLFPTLDFSSGSPPPMWTPSTPTGGTISYQGTLNSTAANAPASYTARAVIGRTAPVPASGVVRVRYTLNMYLQSGPYHEPGCNVVFGGGNEYVHIRFERGESEFKLGSSTNGNYSSPDFPLPIPATTATFGVELRYQLGSTVVRVTGDVGGTKVDHTVPKPPAFVPDSFTIECGIPYAEEGNFGTSVDDIAVSTCDPL